MTEEQDFVREFLIESRENLARLDQEMVELERSPQNRELLASVFRTFHTIKGTCGFLGFARLEAVAHGAEDLLSEFREENLRLDQSGTSVILEAVDAIRGILHEIEHDGREGPPIEAELILRRKIARARNPNDAREAVGPGLVADVRPAALLQGAQPGSASADTTLRIDVALLDRLMNQVGELVLTRNQLLQHNSALHDAGLKAISQRLNLVTGDLQEGVMRARMQPISLIWNKLPRVVRDLAANLGKRIRLELEGAGTELDRTILEAIKDPLTHIVRNSCDHGIERPEDRAALGKPPEGRLTLRAFHERGQVNLEIADDGGGIDPQAVRSAAVERGLISAEKSHRISDDDAVNLVFLPGFSTAKEVTSISGRGVGMDVVRTDIERIGGSVDLSSRSGAGTLVRIRIPLTLAIIPGLVVYAGGQRFVVPRVNLHELIRLEGAEKASRIERIRSAPVLRWRGALLPLADLAESLRLTPLRPPGEVSIIVLQSDERRFGLMVDEIGDGQEIVVKPLGRQLRGLNCYAGATIMGDGRIALILDVAGLGALSGALPGLGETAPAPAAGPAEEPKRLLLVFRSGRMSRLALPLTQVERLEIIQSGSVEWGSGRPVVQYRGRMLPLSTLDRTLEDGLRGEAAGGALQLIVCRDAAREVGLVVDEITDIVEESVIDGRDWGHAQLLGSAVVGGRVTDFPNLEPVFAQAAGAGESLNRLGAAVAANHVRSGVGA